MIKFPENVRYSIIVYKTYYLRLLVYRLKNIFKISYEEAIKIVSQKVKVFGRQHFIEKACEFFEVEYSDNLYDKTLNFRPLKRKLKVFKYSKEMIKKQQLKRLKTHEERYGCKTSFGRKETQDKVKKTFQTKYGGNSPMFSEEVKEKVRNTSLERYGATHCMNFPGVDHNYDYERIKQSFIEKYGVSSPMLVPGFKEKLKESLSKVDYSIVKEKAKKTKLERYGDENFVNTEKAKRTLSERYCNENYVNIEKCKQTKLERYGDPHYNNPEKIKDSLSKLDYDIINEKIKQTLQGKYFDENYVNTGKMKQTLMNIYNITSYAQFHIKNLENYNKEFAEQNFIKDSRFLKDDFEKYFNVTGSTVNKFKRNNNIKTPNKIEKAQTQQFIFDNINWSNKLYNDRSLGFEIDILMQDKNLGVEYNGLMYHSEGSDIGKQFRNTPKNYHLNKTEACLSNNITLFHIFEGEDLDLWLSMINNKLGLNSKIYARKCIIKELKSQDCKTFLEENHLQSYIPAQINIGLFYCDKLVSLMTFSKPRFNKNYEYELIRFCSLKGFNVVGGASKLFKYFLNTYNPKSIITYANRRFSNGDIYKKLGFTFLEKTNPNYFYFKSGSTVLESRNKYQKHKLKDLLEEYNPELSEAENMFNNGYRRIYDCGNLKFEFINS